MPLRVNNMFNIRKILLFINITLIILIIGVLGFAYIRNRQSAMTITNDNDKIKKAVVQEFPRLLSDIAAVGLNIEEFSGKIKFYGADDGALYEIFPKQPAKLIANPNLRNIKQITWSPDNLKVFVSADGKKYIYDFIAQSSYPLNENIRDSLVFSPNSQKILYNFKTASENIITVADYNGQNYSKVISSPAYQPNLSWTLNGAYLWRKANERESESLYLIDAVGRKIAKILNSISGLDALPAPSGLKFIYQEIINEKIVLNFFDLSSTPSGGQYSFKLPFATEVKKCAFSQSEQELYCALSDKIIRFDIIKKSEVEITKINFNAFNLQLTPDEKYLIFQDADTLKPFYLIIK